MNRSSPITKCTSQSGSDGIPGSAQHLRSARERPAQNARAVGDVTDAQVQNSIIRNNSAREEGGGFWISEAAELTLLNDEISGNTAVDGGGGYANGPVALSASTVDHNTATENGGGIYLDNAASFLMEPGSEFLANSAIDGGALYQSETNQEDLILNGGRFIENSASNTGGALYLFSSNLSHFFVPAGATVVFERNTAPLGYGYHNPNLDGIYNSNIQGNVSWSDPYDSQGYNGVDIGGSGDLAGYNIYNNVPVTLTKNAVGAELPGAGEFSFDLYTESGTFLQTVTNDEFGRIVFHVDDIDTRDAPYQFIVRERSKPDGWDLDGSDQEFQILISPTADGGERVVVSFPNQETGRFLDLRQSDTCGLIEFPELTFTEPGVYEYTIKELTGSGNGWDTDTTEYPVRITVTEDEYGNLYATADYPNGFPEFVDTFTGLLARYTISACKIGIGGGLVAGRFEFGVYDEDGNLLGITSNGAADATQTPNARALVSLARQKNGICGDGRIADGPHRGHVILEDNEPHGNKPLPEDGRAFACAVCDRAIVGRMNQMQSRLDGNERCRNYAQIRSFHEQ